MTSLPSVRRLGSLLLLVAAASTGSAQLAAQQPGRPAPPREARGIVKSVDAKARTITTAAVDFGAATEKTYKLAKDAEIALGDGTPRRGVLKAGKLEDLAAGAQVTMTLAEGSDDSIVSILAQGQTLRGPIKSVDAAKKTITITIFSGGREQTVADETFALAGDVEIGVDDGRGRRFSIQPGKLSDVADGLFATLQLTPDRKSVQSLVVEGPSVQGNVTAVDGTKLTLMSGPTRQGEEPSEKSLDVATDAVVLLDDGRGRRLSLTVGKLGDVPVGAFVRARLSGDGKQAVSIFAEGPNTGGILRAVDAEKRTVTVAMFAGREQPPEEKTLDVAADARIVVDGQPAKLDAVKPADNGPFINLRLSLDLKTVQAITVVNR